MWYPPKLRERGRRPSFAPNLPDLTFLGPPQVGQRGDGFIPKDYDFRCDDMLGRAHWKLGGQSFMTVRYYLSTAPGWTKTGGKFTFFGYVLWQEYLNYEVLWDSGECQWEEFESVLILDSFSAENLWENSRGQPNWSAERRFSILRLLQMDWFWKKDGYGCSNYHSFQHLHRRMRTEDLSEIARLVWGQ